MKRGVEMKQDKLRGARIRGEVIIHLEEMGNVFSFWLNDSIPGTVSPYCIFLTNKCMHVQSKW